MVERMAAPAFCRCVNVAAVETAFLVRHVEVFAGEVRAGLVNIRSTSDCAKLPARRGCRSYGANRALATETT